MKSAHSWNQETVRTEVAGLLGVLLVIEAFALPLGWLNAGRTAAWPTSTAFLFWIGAALVNLAVYECTTRAACVLMRPWQPSLHVVLIGGAVLGTPFLEAGKHAYVHAFQVGLIPADLQLPVPTIATVTVLERQVLNILLWVLVNVVLVHSHGLQRFGFVRRKNEAGASSAQDATGDGVRAAQAEIRLPAASPPAFMARLKKPVGTIWAMIAEEHYLRIVGELGEDLILYRIADAAAEMDGRVAGARVHRSYWVASEAIVRSEGSKSKRVLVLCNNMRIPVSRGYQNAGVEAQLISAKGIPSAAERNVAASKKS